MLASVVGAQRQELAVRVERQLDLGHVVAAVRVGDEGLRPRRGPLHRPADRLGGEGDEGLLGVVEDLRAEAAADVGRHHPQLVLGDAEHEGAHQQPDHVRVLAGGVERVLVVGRVVLADRGARLHRVRHQPVVDELERGHVRRRRDRRVDRGAVVLDEAPVEAEVAGRARRAPSARPASSAARMSTTAGSSSMSSSIASAASRACASVSATTAAIGSPTWRTLPSREHRVLRLLHRLAVAVGDQPAAGDAADGLEVLAGEDLEHARHRRRRRGVDRCGSARAPRPSAGSARGPGPAGSGRRCSAPCRSGSARPRAASRLAPIPLSLGHRLASPTRPRPATAPSSAAAAWIALTMLW